jgi:kynurenine formamidase
VNPLKRIVDLSQEIYEGMPVYAGHLETKVWQHHRFEDTARNFDSDFAYQSLGITFCDHGPTHVDALSHLDPRPGAPTIDRMDLAQFCGEGICLDVSSVEPRQYINAGHLERAAASTDLREGDVLLLRTGTADRLAVGLSIRANTPVLIKAEPTGCATASRRSSASTPRVQTIQPTASILCTYSAACPALHTMKI